MQDFTSGYFYFNNCEINEVYSKYNSVIKIIFTFLYMYIGAPCIYVYFF